MELKNINMVERMKHYKVEGLSLACINEGKHGSQLSFGVLEAGSGNTVTGESIFNACSISKFATAMLVLVMSEQGVLDLDENVNDRLTSWKVPENGLTQHKKVTLRTLLSHQAGFIDPEGSFNEYNPVQGIPAITDLLEGRTAYSSAPAEVTHEPGSHFQYSDTGFCIIQQLIEDVSGKPFKRVMNELLLDPLNMNNSTLEYYIPDTGTYHFACGHDKHGQILSGKYPTYPYPAAAGLWSTPGDLALLLSEIMHALQGTSQLGLSKQAVTEMITPQGCSEWTGLGVFLDGSGQELELSSLGWGAGYQSLLIAFPYLGTGAVIMTNADLGVHQTKGIIGEVLKSLLA